MEKQQSLRSSGVDQSSTPREAQKSLAAQPRREAPHRIVDLRNQITAGRAVRGTGAPALPSAPPPGPRPKLPSKQ